MPVSEPMIARCFRGCPLQAALVGLLFVSAMANAYEPERDAWLSREAEPLRPRSTQPGDPIAFAQAVATGNDREPRGASDAELEFIAVATLGNRERVRELLAAGVNPNRPSALPWGERALVNAVERGDVEMVRELLDGGAHPDLRGKGFTALGMAALHGHGRIAHMLLQAGANPDLKGADGNTPLFQAARLDHADVVRALLAGGADVRVTSRGFTEPMLFDMFVLAQRPHFAREDLGIHDYNGLTAPGVAALENNTASLKLMLEAGVDPNFRDRGKLTPIFYAIFRQHRAAIDLLLAHGADPGALRTDF